LAAAGALRLPRVEVAPLEEEVEAAAEGEAAAVAAEDGADAQAT
jgi:hypothetical protein